MKSTSEIKPDNIKERTNYETLYAEHRSKLIEQSATLKENEKFQGMISTLHHLRKLKPSYDFSEFVEDIDFGGFVSDLLKYETILVPKALIENPDFHKFIDALVKKHTNISVPIELINNQDFHDLIRDLSSFDG